MSARTGVLRVCRSCWALTTGDNPCRCGALPPVLSVGGAAEAIGALADLRELLWPAGDVDHEWSADTLDAIATRLEFLRPVPPPAAPAPKERRPALRSVPR